MLQIESPGQHDAFVEALAEARTRLEPPATRERVWPAVAAAALFAVSALVFATAAILAPPAQLTPIAQVHDNG